MRGKNIRKHTVRLKHIKQPRSQRGAGATRLIILVAGRPKNQ